MGFLYSIPFKVGFVKPSGGRFFGPKSKDVTKPNFLLWGCMKGPGPLHIFAPASAYAGPGFRFANNVCEPPAAQSAAFEIRSGGMYAARLEALWASKSPKATADGKIEDFDAAPPERPKWPLPISFSGRRQRRQENDATRKNEKFIFSKGVDFGNTLKTFRPARSCS